MRRGALLVTLAWLWAGPAGAVIVSAGDGTGNTAAPADDFGFLSAGSQAGATAVHLGGGLYLFVRGMSGPATPVVDGVPAGVLGWRPPPALVVALSALLDTGEAS